MDYVLGLDLGATSLGWSVVAMQNGEPDCLVDMGVRIFPDGRDSKTKEPLAVARRIARGMRKRRDRYLLRRETLMNALIKYGLMPQSESEREALEKLNPYALRTRALDEKLPPHELGRALFHINQRRGFKSNRKADRQNAEAGAMKTAIEDLREKMAQSGARTLGEYLYGLNKDKASTQEFVPVRARSHIEKNKAVYALYPERAMYENEFRLIMAKQGLGEEIENRLFHIIFDQRPLKPAERGKCPFEAGEYRCYVAFPAFQKFRALQQINQLTVRDDFAEIPLTQEQRDTLRRFLLEDFSNLDKDFRLTFAKIKTLLKLNKKVKFNLESERRKGLDADATSAKLAGCFGAQWDEVQNEIVDLLINTQDESELKKKLEKYGLSPDGIEKICAVSLPDGTGSLSLKAIEKINPFLEKGLLYDKAVVAAGYVFSRATKGKLPEKYDCFINMETGETYDELPYYAQALPEQVVGGTFAKEDNGNLEKYFGKINNPSVHIALNQLRKLINALVKRYGHPNRIVVELARELKQSKKQREETEKRQAANEKDNKRIGAELERLGVKNNYDNRMKYKLWEDSAKDPTQRCCVFCGKPIPAAELMISAEFEIEHLLPFSRSYLDARSNKVLSCRACNREKANRTPWEAFHEDSRRWNEILARVENLPEDKRWKFQENAFQKLQGENGDVLARMLTDTQYMSRVARQYLCFAANPRFVYGIPGQLTSKLRDHWGLNALFGANEVKDRTDHRHHAIDAFVVACTNRGTLQKYATERRDYPSEMPQEKAPHLPYPDFRLAQIQEMFDRLVISYKADHGNPQSAIRRGQTVAKLHEETYYGMAGEGAKKGTWKLIQRADAATFEKAADLDVLIDQKGTANPIRALLAGRSAAEHKEIIQKYFADRHIRKVRTYRERSKDVVLAFKDKSGKPYRYAIYGGNAYAEIYCPDRNKNAGKWQIEIIPNYCAHQKNFVPKWRHTDAHAKLIMRLHINDMVAYEKDGETIIARVKKITSGLFYLRPHNIAKEEADKSSWAASAEQFRLHNGRKIAVTIDGRILDPKKPKGDADGQNR